MVEPVTEAHEPEAMVDPPVRARLFSITRRPLLGDCAPSGRVRLDALACWIQDVAYCDVEDAGVAHEAAWVLRRTRIHVARFPRFTDHCLVTTFCSGTGRMWAERRTTVTLLSPGGPLATGIATAPAADGGAAGAGPVGTPLVEAVSLWVHLDPERRLPSLLTEAELAVFGESAANRRVQARLRHPRPEGIEHEWDWSFRRTDTDLADHVNNSAYWQPLEEELLGLDGELVEFDAEVEFRTPAQPGPKRILVSGPRRWVTDVDGDTVYASAVLMNARNGSIEGEPRGG